MDLLLTKLHPPPVLEKHVVRLHLLERLDASLHQRLTLVCAPAGYGKTTLLCQWIYRLSRPVGWVSLDRNDNDLAQFLRYFLAAIQNVDPLVGTQTHEMSLVTQPQPAKAFWMPLVNDVAASEKDFVIILDDYHEVEDRAVHEALGYLIEHMPDNMHLILAARADPPLPLPRLRARGQLTELRLNDLRFNAQEVTEFLNTVMALNLAAEDIIAMETKTEGWIASLQMAALSLQKRHHDSTSRVEFVREFTGSHRFILDYLVEEVLKHQPADLQEFLLKTSILERMSGLLCDAVVGEKESGSMQQLEKPQAAGFPKVDSQSILEHLESANLFIIPLDDVRHWYRYHHLFSDLLRKRLWQLYPDLVTALHDRASYWYAQEGFAGEAIHHALAAKAYERAATLIEDNVEATLMRSEVRTFLHWMESLPDEYGWNRPKLAFFHAWALLMSGQSLEVVERRLQCITSLQDAAESTDSMAGRIAALRAYLLLFQGDTILAEKLCNQALENLPESDLFLRSTVTLILNMIRLSAGEQQDGRQAFDKVIRMCQEIGNPLIAVSALSYRARLQMRQGHLQLAHETLEQALHAATDPQGYRLPVASEALIGLGELEREWNNLEKADEYLSDSIELARQWNELASFDAYYPLMRLRLAQGDVAAAREAIETAWKIANRSDLSQLDDILAELQRAYYFVLQGNIAEVMRWAKQHGLAPGEAPRHHPARNEREDYVDTHLRKYEQLVLARAFILERRTGEALQLLDTLLDQARQLDRTDLLIEIQILRALAFQHAGDDDQASDVFAEALTLAEPGGYVRIFLDEGEPVTRLLHQAALRALTPAYVAKLLAASGEPANMERRVKPPHTYALIEPLSEREQEVLRLLSRGLSNPEIARELYIAVSTVRTHCKNIYGKLGVCRRWDAVLRAQELGVI